MTRIAPVILIILSTIPLNAQDGSDIWYVDENEIDSSLIGRFIQVDFYNKSFGSNKFKSVEPDTVQINFIDKAEFVELRNDDYFNNWFFEQYLESTNVEGKKLRIQKMKLLSFSKDSLLVKLFGHYYTTEKEEEFSTYRTDTISISRENIYQVLVHTRPLIRKGLSIYPVYYDNPAFPPNDSGCRYCIEPNEDNLATSPLLDEYHIEQFDYENQRIYLTETGRRIIEKLRIPIRGMPVALTLNGEVIYGFWFWNFYSSIGCDRVYTYAKHDFKIEFGLPKSFTFGDDPRFDNRLKEYSKVE